jgi:TIR domain
MADIFVSYTSSDKAWADWIGQQLEALGHTPRIDAPTDRLWTPA